MLFNAHSFWVVLVSVGFFLKLFFLLQIWLADDLCTVRVSPDLK